MDSRRITHRKPTKLSKEPLLNIPAYEQPNSSPMESNKSLLIHDDDVCNIFSDTSSTSLEIHDTDLPPDKASIINNSNYFKKLSLSFYGTPLSSQKSTARLPSSQYFPKTEGSRLNTSNSPRSHREYYITMKSPKLFSKLDKDPLKLTYSSNTLEFQRSKLKMNNSPIKNGANEPKTALMGKKDKLKYFQNIDRSDKKEIKPSKINTERVSLNVPRSTYIRMYPQIKANNIAAATATIPRYSNFLDKEGRCLKNDGRGSCYIKMLSTKVKPAIQEYFQTEPSSTGMKNSYSSAKGSRPVPKKLTMYAVDNLSMLNLKNMMTPEPKSQSHRSISKDKTPVGMALTARKVQDGSTTKRDFVGVDYKLQKKNSYFG